MLTALVSAKCRRYTSSSRGRYGRKIRTA